MYFSMGKVLEHDNLASAYSFYKIYSFLKIYTTENRTNIYIFGPAMYGRSDVIYATFSAFYSIKDLCLVFSASRCGEISWHSAFIEKCQSVPWYSIAAIFWGKITFISLVRHKCHALYLLEKLGTHLWIFMHHIWDLLSHYALWLFITDIFIATKCHYKVSEITYQWLKGCFRYNHGYGT